VTENSDASSKNLKSESKKYNTVETSSKNLKVSRKKFDAIDIGLYPPPNNNIAADSFHTKKLCSRLSSRAVRFYRGNGRFAFLSPLGELGGSVR